MPRLLKGQTYFGRRVKFRVPERVKSPWLFQTGVDYDWRGILMIAIFYMLRRQTIEPWICRNSVSFPSQAVRQILFTFPLMMHHGVAGAILASVVIFLYDGSRGNIKSAAAKYSFYASYPLHLGIITLIFVY